MKFEAGMKSTSDHFEEVWTGSGAARYAVLSDLHYRGAADDEPLELLCEQVKAQRPSHVLVLGDLVDHPDPLLFKGVKRLLDRLEAPCLVIPGNHDQSEETGALFDAAFPGCRNYSVDSGALRFAGLDTTAGAAWRDVVASGAALEFLRRQMTETPPDRGIVIMSHFPLPEAVLMHLANGEQFCSLLDPQRVLAVHCGHFHGRTTHTHRGIPLLTGTSCSPQVANHDGTREKGYYRCAVEEGRIRWCFDPAPWPPDAEAPEPLRL